MASTWISLPKGAVLLLRLQSLTVIFVHNFVHTRITSISQWFFYWHRQPMEEAIETVNVGDKGSNRQFGVDNKR